MKTIRGSAEAWERVIERFSGRPITAPLSSEPSRAKLQARATRSMRNLSTVQSVAPKQLGGTLVGKYFAAKFRLSEGLSNGDIIIARVENEDGDRVHLRDLLSGSMRNKKRTDLLRRNHVISELDARRIIVQDREGRTAAREMAARLYREKDRR